MIFGFSRLKLVKCREELMNFNLNNSGLKPGAMD
jgi:hypothetical protein